MRKKTTGFLGQDLKKPDGQGRIAIGREFSDDTYSVEPQQNGDIILRPVVVIHKQEAWLFQNREALASVKRGLEQAARGEVEDLGTFAQFASDTEEGE